MMYTINPGYNKKATETCMYCYFSPRTTCPGGLVVSTSSYKTRGPGSKKKGKDQESLQSSTTRDPEVTTSQLDITNESQEVSPFKAGDHKASLNRHA